MRASCLFYSFAATGLALLVLANYTLFDDSLHSRRQPPTRPRMKRETVVAETAVPSAASHRKAVVKPGAAAGAGAASAASSAGGAARASALSGSLPQSCRPTPDAVRQRQLRLLSGGTCVAGSALCAALASALQFGGGGGVFDAIATFLRQNLKPWNCVDNPHGDVTAY